MEHRWTCMMGKHKRHTYLVRVQANLRAIIVRASPPPPRRFHSAHIMTLILAHTQNREAYSELEDLYNPVRPRGSPTLPPIEERLGTTSLCDNIICRCESSPIDHARFHYPPLKIFCFDHTLTGISRNTTPPPPTCFACLLLHCTQRIIQIYPSVIRDEMPTYEMTTCLEVFQ